MSIKTISQKWWFWMAIVMIVFSMVCLLTRTEVDPDALNSDLEIELSTSDVPKDKSNSTQYQEDTYGIAYWEASSGKDMFDSLCLLIDADDTLTMLVSGEYIYYLAVSDVYSVYIEADCESDEIHYVTVAVLDFEEADVSVLMASLYLVDETCTSFDEEDLWDLETSMDEFYSECQIRDTEGETNGFSYAWALDQAYIEMDYSDGAPVVEYLAYDQ